MNFNNVIWLRLGAAIPAIAGLIVIFPLIFYVLIIVSLIDENDGVSSYYALLWGIAAIGVSVFNVYSGSLRAFNPEKGPIKRIWILSAAILILWPAVWRLARAW